MKNQSFYQEFSQRLCYLRKVTGLTQKNVADYLQLDRSAYSCYELRRSAPSLDKLCQLARLYRVSTDFLLGVESLHTINVSDLSAKDVAMLTDLADRLRSV